MSHSKLSNFLKKYKHIKNSDNPITHTRIGDKDKDIYGGSYSIPYDNIDEFYKIYNKHVIKNNNFEYLTEKQLDDGVIAIDLDFRYKGKVNKLHTDGNLFDLIGGYTDCLKELIKFDDKSFPIYIFEKDNVKYIEDSDTTKDGIHIIIGIKLNKKLQIYLRQKIIDKIKSSEIDDWNDLPISNSWESVFDDGITKGSVNWQLYGSRKPNCESYKLKNCYNLTYDESDGEFNYEILKVSEILKNPFPSLSVRNTDIVSYEITDLSKELMKTTKSKPKRKLKLSNKSIYGYGNLDINDLTSIEKIDYYLQLMLNEVGSDEGKRDEYFIKETHHYVDILPEEFYSEYSKWMQVGWALKNTDNRLFISWIKFSAKWDKFDYSDIPALYEKWNGIEIRSVSCGYVVGGLSAKSIMYWARCHANLKDYNSVKINTVDFYINKCLEDINKTGCGDTDYDIALAVHQLLKDRFVCVSIKNNIWYEFRKHRWEENDSGIGLKNAISKEMWNCIHRRLQQTLVEHEHAESDEAKMSIRGRIQTLASIALKLKDSNKKTNIFKEARSIFYDKNFMDNQDANPYLIGFNNGVYDFENDIFRDGRPDDYIVKSTNIDYVSFDKIPEKTIEEIDTFMEQLFPIKELRDYMWSHLASTLIGSNENQTFNIYNGCGRNGKSILVKLMEKCLGDYKATVPITLITQKRNSIGSTSSEIVALKGVRYAVMQEPTKGDKINEGILKEITGGDPLQGRALYKDSITFNPQFKLVVCTNTLFEIKSQDDGTWRRIRVCEFVSKFKEQKDIDNDPDEPYQFKVDKKLDEKFDEWKYAFNAKLLEISRTNKGLVEDCSIVMSKSNEYRADTDILGRFIKDKVSKDEGKFLRKTEVWETFKLWWDIHFGTNQGKPQGKELYDYINKKFGKQKGDKWIGIGINYDYDDVDEEDDD